MSEPKSLSEQLLPIAEKMGVHDERNAIIAGLREGLVELSVYTDDQIWKAHNERPGDNLLDVLVDQTGIEPVIADEGDSGTEDEITGEKVGDELEFNSVEELSAYEAEMDNDNDNDTEDTEVVSVLSNVAEKFDNLISKIESSKDNGDDEDAPGVLAPNEVQQLTETHDLLLNLQHDRIVQEMVRLASIVCSSGLSFAKEDLILSTVERARFHDYICTLLSEMGFTAEVKNIAESGRTVTVRNFTFRAGVKYTLHEIESVLPQAIQYLNRLKTSQLTVNGLHNTISLQKQQLELAKGNIRHAEEDASRARSELAELQSLPTPEKALEPSIVVRWPVTINKKDGTKTTMYYYLTTDEQVIDAVGVENIVTGVKLESITDNKKFFGKEGYLRSKYYARTRDRRVAINFSSRVEARDTLNYMLKWMKNIPQERKITERAIKAAEIIQAMDLKL